MFSYKVSSVSTIVFFSILTYTVTENTYKGVDHMNIEIKPQSKVQEIFRKFHNKSEDILFSIVQKVPEPLISDFVMNWVESYIDKRTRKLKEEIIRQKWQQAYLEKVAEEIHGKQDKKKAP